MVGIIDFGLPILVEPTGGGFQPTDLVDYFFQFPDFGTALRDPVVGPFYFSPPLAGFTVQEVLVYPNQNIDSVDPASGFWCKVTDIGLVNALQTHPNVRIINDLTLMGKGQPSVLFSTLANTVINIVVSTIGFYGLLPIAAIAPLPPPPPPTPPANGLLAEDGATFLVAEDGATFLVQE